MNILFHNVYVSHFDMGSTVTLVHYQGELLYNVLLENHGMMKVHNMLVETLDPTSDVAIFYKAKLSPKQKNTIKNY